MPSVRLFAMFALLAALVHANDHAVETTVTVEVVIATT